jgi:hypothetical protein
MTGAVWNFDRPLSVTSPISNAKKAGLARITRAEVDRSRSADEQTQLVWRPEPGRTPYAGRDLRE